jgi:hypothetical protein
MADQHELWHSSLSLGEDDAEFSHTKVLFLLRAKMGKH